MSANIHVFFLNYSAMKQVAIAKETDITGESFNSSADIASLTGDIFFY